ncbi:hypothetical protein JKP88DRAFT_266633 [Tribonema minus]|uniref:Ribosome biogenesis protein SLX9 n=1 Tax=Tribonema minus TaxID=303371 RepID=A0A835ZIC9_9STRA|nr:hypothetical protein JKP88DRAFT_266633 [Tribonema minus]
MAKAKRATKLRNAAAKKPVSSAVAKPSDENLSRGQRKRATKRAALVRKRTLVTANVEQRKQEAAKGLGSMGGLMETLTGAAEDASGPSQKRKAAKAQLRSAPARRIITNKGKRSVAEKELAQLAAVLANESFKRDPFAAIQAHMKLTLPVEEAAAAANTSGQTRAGRKKGKK